MMAMRMVSLKGRRGREGNVNRKRRFERKLKRG
jgi:hypothetical protein